MTSEVHTSEAQAMRVLMRDGDFSEGQARIVLMHSRKQAYEGATYYPATYVSQRAADNAARDN